MLMQYNNIWPIKIILQAFEYPYFTLKIRNFKCATWESNMPQGTVKWFNNAKGYGFIIEDGKTEDLFAHFSAIQMEGYKTLKAGQPVCFEMQPGDKGTHAVNITAVEQAQPSSSQEDDEFISVEEETVSYRNEETPKETSKHSDTTIPV
jgi:CspA family cold shock protein